MGRTIRTWTVAFCASTQTARDPATVSLNHNTVRPAEKSSQCTTEFPALQPNAWVSRLKNAKRAIMGKNLTQWFIHSFTGMWRMRRFLAVLRCFFHSSLLCTLSLHPIPPASLPSFLTSSCHLFLGLLSALLFPNSYIILFLNSIFFHSLYTPKLTQSI